MIRDQTTGLLNQCCKEIPHPARNNSLCRRRHGFDTSTSCVVMFKASVVWLTEPVTARFVNTSESQRT